MKKFRQRRVIAVAHCAAAEQQFHALDALFDHGDRFEQTNLVARLRIIAARDADADLAAVRQFGQRSEGIGDIHRIAKVGH